MQKPPYAHNPATIKKFFQTIQGLGVPPNVTVGYLSTIQFKSRSDRDLIRILRFIGFIDNSGVPTKKWNEYKDKIKASQVMASSIRSAYDELFNTYSDAHKTDSGTLQNYFGPKLGLSTQLSKLTEQTFKQLCGLAKFEGVEVTPPPVKPTEVAEGLGEVSPGVKPVTININIQLQLPATEDTSIYESLFAALKKYLFS